MTSKNGSARIQARNDAALDNVFASVRTASDTQQYQSTGAFPLRLPKLACEELYRIPICRRVCRAKADSAILKGWDLTLGGKSRQKIISAYNKESKRLKIPERFNEAQVLANIYKGAVIVANIDDGRHWSEPINEKALRSVRSLRVLDCYKIAPVLDGSLFNPSEPEFYQMFLPKDLKKALGLEQKESAKGASREDYVHHSRVIRFDGVSLPPDMMAQEGGWGMSLLDSIWEDFCDWKSSLKALKGILEGFNTFTYKISKLGDLVNDFGEDALRQRFQTFRRGIEVLGAAAIDKENEDISYTSKQLGGIDAVADKLRDAFIGATGIPHTRLFGASPSGLGATGESEEKDWSASVGAFQKADWEPKLSPLIRLILLSSDFVTKGKEPEDWGIKFHSLIGQSESDVAQLRSTIAQTDNTYLSAGILLPEEVRARFAGAEFSTEITLDAAAWDKSKEQPESEFGGEFGAEDPNAELSPAPEEAGEEEVTPLEDEPVLDSARRDSSPPVKRVVRWQGLNLGVTHDPDDYRFEGSLPMIAHYGHLRGSYGHASDGLAHDFYIQPNIDLEQAKLFKIRQNHPETGFKDEDKYAIASTPDVAKHLYIYHAGRERFGGIDPVDSSELGQYKTHLDSCECEVCKKKKKRKRKRQDAVGVPDDTAIEYLLKESLKEGNKVTSSWLDSAKGWMNEMTSLEEVRDRIPELFNQLQGDEFAQLIEQTTVLSHLDGMDSVNNE